MKQTIAILALTFVSAGCPSTGAGMIHRDAIRPSVDSITLKFDEMVVEAASRGVMDPIEADVWLGETLLLRHVVSGEPGAVATPTPALAPPGATQ